MRRIAIACVVCALWTTVALAKPKLAVLPLEGDTGDRVAEALGDAMSDRTSVVGSAKVSRAMDKAGVSGKVSARDAKKLQDELDADVVLYGDIEKAGANKTLQLKIAVKGKKTERATIKFRAAGTEKFRKDVRRELDKALGEDAKPANNDDEDDDDDKKKKKRSPFGGGGGDDEDEDRKRKADDDDRKRKADDDDRKRKADEDDRKRKAAADDDDKKRKKRKRVADEDDDDDDDGGKVRKKKKRRGSRDDDTAGTRHPLTQLGARGGAGMGFGLRRLTYASTGRPPPKVSTGAAAARIEAEVYPLVLAGVSGPAAGLGFAGDFEKTFGLAIAVPTGGETPIDQSHYSIGARYRLGFGSSSVGVGVSYFRRKYVADRSSLANPAALDMPDVNYSAVAVGVAARIGAGPSAALVLDTDVLLVTNTGAIQKSDSFGAANVLGFEVLAGVDYALSKQLALRFGTHFTQFTFDFKGTGGMAMRREVSGATDRVFGLSATLAATY